MDEGAWLTTFVVLQRFAELGFAQGAFQAGEQVGNGLGVIPDVSAGTVAAAGVIAATLPGPQSAIGLPQHGWGLEDGQVGGDGFEDFGRQCRIVETVAEHGGFFAQFVVMIAPVKADAVDIGKSAGVPRSVLGGIR